MGMGAGMEGRAAEGGMLGEIAGGENFYDGGGRYLSHRRIARVFCLRTIPSAYGTTTLAVGVSVPITSSPWRCALVFQTKHSPCLSPRYSRYAALPQCRREG